MTNPHIHDAEYVGQVNSIEPTERENIYWVELMVKDGEFHSILVCAK